MPVVEIAVTTFVGGLRNSGSVYKNLSVRWLVPFVSVCRVYVTYDHPCHLFRTLSILDARMRATTQSEALCCAIVTRLSAPHFQTRAKYVCIVGLISGARVETRLTWILRNQIPVGSWRTDVGILRPKPVAAPHRNSWKNHTLALGLEYHSYARTQ